MPRASYPSGVLEHAAFNAAHLSDVAGDAGASPAPLNKPQSQSGDRCLPVIDRLFGALIDVPPSVWRFV
jgi:hypothetical protein